MIISQMSIVVGGVWSKRCTHGAAGSVQLRSRNDKEFGRRYPTIVNALSAIPDETVVDGEVVALEVGRPSFNALQNYGTGATPLFYYVFEILILAGEEVTSEPLLRRQELLQTRVLVEVGRSNPRIADLGCHSARPDPLREGAPRFEGNVAKRVDSRYEVGLRSGMWQKMRVKQGQEFVIGGYTAQCKETSTL